MPLKHFTETLLVFLLGLLTILVGVAVASLPVLPRGILPWITVFGVALLYPLAIYPILKRDRADYAFRLLHFGPVAIALVWFLTQVASLRFPRILILGGVWTFGWSLIPILILFFLMELFCLHVIRQRSSRSLLLLLLIVPFTAVALSARRIADPDAIIASALWRGTWWDLTNETATTVPGSGTEVAFEREGVNLSRSAEPSEEEWRAKIPPSSRLPKAGIDPTSLMVAMLAAYTTVVHYRMKRRACSLPKTLNMLNG